VPRSVRTRTMVRVSGIGAATILAGIVALYALLFGMQIYSAHQASSLLDQVEAMRAGAPYSDFENAIRGCRIEKTPSGEVCILRAGAYRLERFWSFVRKLPDEWSDSVLNLSYKAGLRYWQLTVPASRENDRIRTVSVGLFVVGRYEALGAQWLVGDAVPQQYEQFLRTADDRRTYMHWYHITSRPSGEGFGIYATTGSTDKELLARQVNRKCFTSFRGCDGLCELLPHAVGVLEDRRRSWGGCSDVPRSWCELSNNTCKSSFRQTFPNH
jgi:hypothetical protein